MAEPAPAAEVPAPPPLAPGEVPPYNFGKLLLNFLKIYWKSIFIFLWPIIWCFLCFTEKGQAGSKYKCMYVVIIMGGFWLTECVPLYVTGIIPVFFFPLLNVLPSEEVCLCYFKEVNMLFVSSIMLAIAIEYSDLHKRIALLAIKCIGTNPRFLHLSIVSVGCFLSMWMMNTAVTAMMLPIAKAIIEELQSIGIGDTYEPQTPEQIANEELATPTKVTKAFMIGVAYSTSLGGLCTIIGTGTTLTYRGLLESKYPDSEGAVEFVPWALYSAPIHIALNFFMWMWIQFVFLGLFRPKSKDAAYCQKAKEFKVEVKTAIHGKYDELGKWRFHEIMVGILFFITVVLWFFRRPSFMNGWTTILVEDWVQNKSGMMKNSVVAMAILFLMLVLPQDTACFYAFSKHPEKRPKKASLGLVTWKVIQEKFPWGLIFLLGGGFAVAKAGDVSGMSRHLGNKMTVFKSMDKYVVACITTFVTATVTELVSNMAAVNLLIPIFFSIADSMNASPLLLGHPAAMAASYTFLLPVGTPMNAMAAGYANLKTVDFMVAGIGLKLASYGLLVGTYISYGRFIWDIETVPKWAH